MPNARAQGTCTCCMATMAPVGSQMLDGLGHLLRLPVITSIAVLALSSAAAIAIAVASAFVAFTFDFTVVIDIFADDSN